ncbi:MAG: hypothetical protein M3R44_00200 [Candidatus Eremiobacteraeota bacterium]|nr:hypothetical protein [Candidatus Eremiobacteraeota bacterium]
MSDPTFPERRQNCWKCDHRADQHGDAGCEGLTPAQTKCGCAVRASDITAPREMSGEVHGRSRRLRGRLDS